MEIQGIFILCSFIFTLYFISFCYFIRWYELLSVDLEKDFSDVRMVFQMQNKIFECVSSFVTKDWQGFEKETYIFKPISSLQTQKDSNINDKSLDQETIILDDFRIASPVPGENLDVDNNDLIYRTTKTPNNAVGSAFAFKLQDPKRFVATAEIVNDSYLRGVRFTYELIPKQQFTSQQLESLRKEWYSNLTQ
jgi:hypothetical protein